MTPDRTFASDIMGMNLVPYMRTLQDKKTTFTVARRLLDVTRDGDIVSFTVQANAFLHHQVRNMVGSLLEVGAGLRPESWIADVLESRDRTQAGPTAPAQGLVFVGPRYPREWRLPDEVLFDA